jgi:hypothetical protein
MTEEEYMFVSGVRKTITAHPEWIGGVIQAVQAGISDKLAQQNADLVDWEAIALTSMEARLKGRHWVGGRKDRSDEQPRPLQLVRNYRKAQEQEMIKILKQTALAVLIVVCVVFWTVVILKAQMWFIGFGM